LQNCSIFPPDKRRRGLSCSLQMIPRCALECLSLSLSLFFFLFLSSHYSEQSSDKARVEVIKQGSQIIYTFGFDCWSSCVVSVLTDNRSTVSKTPAQYYTCISTYYPDNARASCCGHSTLHDTPMSVNSKCHTPILLIPHYTVSHLAWGSLTKKLTGPNVA
jgi:hypothetical protein